MSGRTASGRKLLKRACDACKVRKIKCSELPPCDGCATAGIPCIFKKVPSTRGPRTLRQKTFQQINQRQRLFVDNEDDDPTGSGPSCPFPDVGSTPSSQNAGTTLAQGPVRASNPGTSVPSLALRLCIYRLRLFPVWPIVAVEDIMASLQRDGGKMVTYALANAVGAATMAQLKLDSLSDAATASSMEAECQRTKGLDGDGRHASLDTLRIAFFLHVYHENQEPGGIQSLLYLREAITLAQIMGLHRESTYTSLAASEQEIRRRIIWLLFVTERGVAMLHNLPVVLKCSTHFPSEECDDGNHILPAFQKLISLFWIFDQSGAFDILQNTDVAGFDIDGTSSPHRNSLEALQRRLQDVPIDWESSNDVQRADICVTRQWMRAILWRISFLRNSNSDQVTSLSHPIQIAKEFLAVIRKLPTTAIESHGPSIEFKIYEIASAVTDAISINLRGWTFSENAREVLSQLHQILASCRGGNVSLASMLRAKIAHIHDQQTLLLEPSSRIEEISEEISEEWPDQMRTHAGLSFEVDNSYQLPSFIQSSRTSQKDSEDIFRARRRSVEVLESVRETQPQFRLEGQTSSWTSTIGEELTTMLSNSADLYEQMQNLDGSLDSFQSFDSLDSFLSETDIMQRLASDGPSNVFSTSSVFTQ